MYTLDHKKALSDAIKYNPNDKQNNIIRRCAYYLYLQIPKQSTRVFYDHPDYPNWHGGFTATGLVDTLTRRTYGLILVPVERSPKLQAGLLKLARKAYKNNTPTRK